MKFVDADMKWVSDCWSGFGLNGAQSTGIGNWLRVYAVIVIRNTFLSIQTIIEPEPCRVTEGIYI